MIQKWAKSLKKISLIKVIFAVTFVGESMEGNLDKNIEIFDRHEYFEFNHLPFVLRQRVLTFLDVRTIIRLSATDKENLILLKKTLLSFIQVKFKSRADCVYKRWYFGKECRKKVNFWDVMEETDGKKFSFSSLLKKKSSEFIFNTDKKDQKNVGYWNYPLHWLFSIFEKKDTNEVRQIFPSPITPLQEKMLRIALKQKSIYCHFNTNKKEKILLSDFFMFERVHCMDVSDRNLTSIQRILKKTPHILYLYIKLIKGGEKSTGTQMESFMQFLQTRTLLSIKIEGSKNPEGLWWGLSFMQLIKSIPLAALTLESLNIKAEHVKSLAEDLKVNTTLLSLNLENNEIGDGLQYLAEALKINTTLTSLDLSKNHHLPEKFLIDILTENKGLRNLVLNHCELDCGMDFIEALEKNTTLTAIHLIGNKHDSSSWKKLKKFLRLNNNTLLKLRLDILGSPNKKEIKKIKALTLAKKKKMPGFDFFIYFRRYT